MRHSVIPTPACADTAKSKVWPWEIIFRTHSVVSQLMGTEGDSQDPDNVGVPTNRRCFALRGSVGEPAGFRGTGLSSFFQHLCSRAHRQKRASGL